MILDTETSRLSSSVAIARRSDPPPNVSNTLPISHPTTISWASTLSPLFYPSACLSTTPSRGAWTVSHFLLLQASGSPRQPRGQLLPVTKASQWIRCKQDGCIISECSPIVKAGACVNYALSDCSIMQVLYDLLYLCGLPHRPEQIENPTRVMINYLTNIFNNSQRAPSTPPIPSITRSPLKFFASRTRA